MGCGEWRRWARYGIDLVAKLRDEEGFAAIQCKFYSPQHRVQKKDIDSFLSASSRHPFVYRVVIDTTEVDWERKRRFYYQEAKHPSCTHWSYCTT